MLKSTTTRPLTAEERQRYTALQEHYEARLREHKENRIARQNARMYRNMLQEGQVGTYDSSTLKSPTQP